MVFALQKSSIVNIILKIFENLQNTTYRNSNFIENLIIYSKRRKQVQKMPHPFKEPAIICWCFSGRKHHKALNFIYHHSGPQVVFIDPGPQFVFTGPSPKFVFSGPGPKFLFTRAGQSGAWACIYQSCLPGLYLLVVAYDLYSQALNLYSPFYW